MQVELLGVNQKLLFRTRAVVNVLSLRLPNGDAVDVDVPDDVAQKIITAFFKGGEGEAVGEALLPSSSPVTNDTIRPQALHDGEEDAPFVFGGGEEEKQTNGHVALSSEVPPPPPLPRRAVHVDKDSQGYPVIRGGVHASTVTGGDNPDEDGVGSV